MPYLHLYRCLSSFCILLLIVTTTLSASVLRNEKVITIHGILGSSWNMYYLAKPLRKAKMNVVHWDYPSRKKVILDHAADLVIKLRHEAKKDPAKPIHFLTHSMGGLVLRAALNHPKCPQEARIGSAVLIAPPNQGSAWGRYIKTFYLVRCIGGDGAGVELMNEKDFEHLGQFPDTMHVMVIAGNTSINPFIEGDNDGTLTVEETFLKTPHQHEIVSYGHKTILLSKQAAQFTKKFFLKNLGE